MELEVSLYAAIGLISLSVVCARANITHIHKVAKVLNKLLVTLRHCENPLACIYQLLRRLAEDLDGIAALRCRHKHHVGVGLPRKPFLVERKSVLGKKVQFREQGDFRETYTSLNPESKSRSEQGVSNAFNLFLQSYALSP